MFQKLPSCVLLQILEFACEEIVQDCRSVDLAGVPFFGLNLRRFRWLILVNKQFHSLLMDAVRVEGRLIRLKLLDMQEERFKALLFTQDPSSDAVEEVHRSHTISELRAWCACGPIWFSPRLASLIYGCFWFVDRFQPFLFFKFLYSIRDTIPRDTMFSPTDKTDGAQQTHENQKNITPPHVADQHILWELDVGPVLSFTVGNWEFGSCQDFEPDTCYWNCVSMRDLWIGGGRTEGTIYNDDNDDESFWLWYRFMDRRLEEYVVLNYKEEAIYASKFGRWYSTTEWNPRKLPKMQQVF
jgi:hypothetical protein